MTQHTKVAVLSALVALATSCSATDSNQEAPPSVAETVIAGVTVPVTPLSEEGRQFLSPQAICETLTPEDMAPLTDGEVTDTPTSTTDLGLPGCKWPVENGWGWLELSVFKPVSVDALITISKEHYRVGNSTAYQVGRDGVGTCRGIVVSPEAPRGYVLGLTLQGVPQMTSDNPDLCQLAIPQTAKVLQGLGW